MGDNDSHPARFADFPVEIIREILLSTYPLHAERFRGKSTLSWDEDLARPDITPNSLSSVCQLWDAVLADIPDFWKHIVVHLDQPGHLEFFRLALERSRGADVESVTISNSTRAVDVDEKEEQAALRVIIDILRAPDNRFRIHSLVVRTRWRESLPINMLGPWEKLRVLKLESEFMSTVAQPSQPAQPFTLPEAAPRSFPLSLGVLSLTGPMFVHLWRDATGRTAMRDKALLSFTISHIRPEDGGRHPVTFEEFANAAFSFVNASITNIVDVDVPFAYGRDHRLENIYSTYGERLSFERIPLFLVIVLIGRVWGQNRVPNTGLASCTICDCRGVLSTSERRAVHAGGLGRIKVLYLEVMEIADSGDLALLLERINAEEVHIIQCPGFDDYTLRGFFNRRMLSLDSTNILHIKGCDSFSQNQLPALVARTKGVMVEIHDDTTVITWTEPKATE